MRSMVKLTKHRHAGIAFTSFPLPTRLTKRPAFLIAFPHIPSATYLRRHAFLADVGLSTAGVRSIFTFFNHRPLSTRLFVHGGRQDRLNCRARRARAQTRNLQRPGNPDPRHTHQHTAANPAVTITPSGVARSLSWPCSCSSRAVAKTLHPLRIDTIREYGDGGKADTTLLDGIRWTYYRPDSRPS